MSQHPSPPRSKERRRWLATGVAVTAAAGGAAVLWQLSQGANRNDEAVKAFWALELPGVDGTVFRVAALQGQPLLVNFWATWCPPCIRELPLINGFAQAQAPRGAQAIRVLGVAVDQAAPVSRWLARNPLDFPVALAGAGGVGLTRSLGNLSGGLPFTLLLDARGRVQQRKMGELSEQDLAQWASFA